MIIGPGINIGAGITISSPAVVVAPLSLTFTSTVRTMNGYAPNGRSGWTLGALTPTSYDDGVAGPYTNVMPSGTSWYMNNVSYSQYYVGSNGYLAFTSPNTASTVNLATINAPAIGPCTADEYWGTNGANSGTNTPNGFAYKFGTTSTGWNFFSANIMGYQFNTVYNERSWEINCFWNADNSKQYVEIVYSPNFNSLTVNSFTGLAGILPSNGGTAVSYSGTTYAQPNNSMAFSSIDKGVTWTLSGQGSWSGTGTF